MAADDHMDMTTHDAIGAHLKAFVFLTIPYAVKKDVFVFASNENIEPVNNGKGHKIEGALIANLVFATHCLGPFCKHKIIKSEDLKNRGHKLACCRSRACRRTARRLAPTRG